MILGVCGEGRGDDAVVWGGVMIKERGRHKWCRGKITGRGGLSFQFYPLYLVEDDDVVVQGQVHVGQAAVVGWGGAEGKFPGVHVAHRIITDNEDKG